MKKDRLCANRVYFLIGAMGFWAALIGLRLFQLQVVSAAFYQEKAQKAQVATLKVTPHRGNIYARNRALLAGSRQLDSAFAQPANVEDPARTASVLFRLTGEPASKWRDRIEKGAWMWIQRKISADQAAAIAKANLPGVGFQKEYRRSYPKKQLAAQTLGHVDIDEEGRSGLEQKYNDFVRGEPESIQKAIDARRRGFGPLEEPKPGANLITTLDEKIQYFAEKAVQSTAASTRAKAISVTVMDPRNGEILAMASDPPFDPNESARSDETVRRNLAVRQVYEPGSTFKILTVAAALEEGLTTPDEVIDCQMGSIVIAGHTIHDHKPFGLLSVKGVMQHSSDVGVIKLGQRLGDQKLYSYIERFGFGRPTGIDLPAEEKGLLRPPSAWSKISIGAISMGQEIGVTPLQILSMVAAVANGGTRYRPYVVSRVEGAGGEVLLENRPQGERIMSEKTSIQIGDMLEVVVTDGTARSSRLDGYRAAGKTGTAQKIVDGRYSKTKYVASFAGYAPASKPEIAIIVVIDEPVGAYHGGDVAAPVFKTLAEQILRYRAVPSDVPLFAPRYVAPSKGAATTPKSSEEPGKWRKVDVAAPAADGNVVVPDFRGDSMRQAQVAGDGLGIQLVITGSGRAVSQNPAPGTRIRTGGRVEVRLSSRR